MTRIDARKLFAAPGCKCGSECCAPEPTVLWRITIARRLYLTDRAVMIRATYLDRRIKGRTAWARLMPHEAPVDRRRPHWSADTLPDEPVTRRFRARYVAAIYEASCRIAVTTDPNVHHILDPAGERIGCIMPGLADDPDPAFVPVPEATMPS